MERKQNNRGILAAVAVTVILTWIMIALIWNHDRNQRAAAREARRAAVLSTSPVPEKP